MRTEEDAWEDELNLMHRVRLAVQLPAACLPAQLPVSHLGEISPEEVFVLVVLLSIAACVVIADSPVLRNDLRWHWVCRQNTLAGYAAYLEIWPQDRYAVEAKLLCDELSWSRAPSANTADAMLDYLQKTADGHHAAEAHQQFDERLWAEAVADDTVEDAYVFAGTRPWNMSAGRSAEPLHVGAVANPSGRVARYSKNAGGNELAKFASAWPPCSHGSQTPARFALTRDVEFGEPRAWLWPRAVVPMSQRALAARGRDQLRSIS